VARTLGADVVVDRLSQDFVQLVKEVTDGRWPLTQRRCWACRPCPASETTTYCTGATRRSRPCRSTTTPTRPGSNADGGISWPSP
jgi:hypothetical protein